MKTADEKVRDSGTFGEQEDNGRPRLHTILVPMEDDGSCSKKALQYAVPFARMLNARLVLLNILPTRSLQTFVFDPKKFKWVPEENEQDQMVQRLSRLAAQVVPRGVPVEIRVAYGMPSSLIVNVAGMLEVDLVIISTHCYKGLLYLLMGSVAGRVARLSPCPVLVVREKEHEFLPVSPALIAKASI